MNESELFATVARATLGAVGTAFFDALSQALATALGADYAFVGDLIDGGARVRTLSMWADGGFAPELVYDLDGTPCNEVVHARACVHPRGVQQRFPRDQLLVDMGIDAYCGIPVQSADGTPRGILVALFRAPLPERLDAASLSVAFELFAARAAAEMDRVAALAELEQAKRELERRVDDRTRELREANQELEAFAYTVSHDLRAPLRHVSSYTSLLEQTAGDALPEEARRQLDVIRVESSRMNQLIEGLLAFSRTTRQRLEARSVALAPLVREIAGELPGTDRVTWELGELPSVHADPTLVRVVLRNLLDNAVKYSRRSTPPRVAVTSETTPAHWLVRVRDNGVGFDMAYADKLFGVFRRLHHDSDFEGTGIGLATVHRIISRHGGQVRATSTPGEGSEFTFTLPRPGA